MSRKKGSRPIQKVKPRPLLHKVAAPALILLAACIAVWPMLQRGESCGADFSFHLASWLDAQRSIFQGIPFPHWAGSPNFNAGEPRFVFYPPLTGMTGAFLGMFFPWDKVSIALAFLLFAGTGFAHRALAREVLDEGPATLAGCASIFLGNLLLDTYMRSDYAELTGGIWIPLLLLFILRNRPTAATTLAHSIEGVCPLALVIAGIWLTNGPLGIMSTYLLLAVSIVSAVFQKSWEPAIRAAASFALGLSLAAVYLLPAIWERPWVNFHAAISQREYRFENGWLLHLHTDPSWALYDTTLDLHSWLALIMLSITAASMLIVWKRGMLKARAAWWLPIALIPIAVLFMQLPLSALLWKHLPALQFLQFPWRWLVCMIPPLAISFAAAVWVTPLRGRLPILAACSFLFLFISAGTWGICFQNCHNLDSAIELSLQQDGVWGKPEYAPPGVAHSLVERNAPKNCVVDNLAGLSRESTNALKSSDSANPPCQGNFSEGSSLPEHKVFSGTAQHNGFLILNLRSYPAWRITLNGQPVQPAMEPEYGLTAVPVRQGQVQITADWTTTGDVWAGRALSVLALLLLTVVSVTGRRRSALQLK